MGAFTSPNNVGWPPAAFWKNQMQRAERERHRAIYCSGPAWDVDRVGFGGDPPIANAGVSVQPHTLTFGHAGVAWLQRGLNDTMGLSFVDHTVGSGDFSGEASIPMFSVASFATAAGLPTGESTEVYDGWRASKLHPDSLSFVDYDNRSIESADILGKWLFEDLQKAFVAMKWTNPPAVYDSDELTVEVPDDPFSAGDGAPVLDYVFDVYDYTGVDGTLNRIATDQAKGTTVNVPGGSNYEVVVKWVFTHDALPA
jgi:hypothetical protein